MVKIKKKQRWYVRNQMSYLRIIFNWESRRLASMTTSGIGAVFVVNGMKGKGKYASITLSITPFGNPEVDNPVYRFGIRVCDFEKFLKTCDGSLDSFIKVPTIL